MRRALINPDVAACAESFGVKGFRIKIADELLSTRETAQPPVSEPPPPRDVGQPPQRVAGRAVQGVGSHDNQPTRHAATGNPSRSGITAAAAGAQDRIMTFSEASLITGDLTRTVSGNVIKPGDTSWDEVRRPFNLRMHQHIAAGAEAVQA